MVLEPENWERRLDPTFTDVEKLRLLLVATVQGTLDHHPVDRAVGNVKNDGPELMEAVVLEGDSAMNRR